MQTPSFLKLAALSVLAVSAALPAVAQGTPTSGPTPTVVYAGGDDIVIKATDGKLLNFTVPAGYKFSVGGKPTSLAELKPGTKLSDAVAPGSIPKVVTGVSVAKGKVFAATPPDGLTLSLAEGTKDLVVPAGTSFMVDGKKVSLGDLKPGMMVEATIVTTAADDAVGPATATSAPAMSGALLVAHTASSADDLPAAGTHLPLAGVMGLGCLAIGLALLRFRKPLTQV